MNVLFTIRGNEPYVSQQAQIELMVGLQKKGVTVYLLGQVSDDVKYHLKKLNIPFIDLFPRKSIDKDFIQKFEAVIVKHQINLVHFLESKICRNGLIALKNHKQVKTVMYYGSFSLHWYDPTAYLTQLHPRIDKIIGNSNHVYQHVKKQLFGKNKQKAVRVFKGYNPDWFNNIPPFDYSTLNIPKDAIKVCFVGNHRKVKGTRYFLESSYHLNSDKDIHYFLIGEKTNEGELAKISEKSPIKNNIHFLGKRSDVVSLLKSCDIYTQTSLKEGFGRAISEAMSVGKPVVMTNAGGCTELIDESSGIVTPLKDAKAIANAISSLANNDTLRLKMGKNATNRIQTVYHINDTINDTYLLYKELLNDSL